MASLPISDLINIIGEQFFGTTKIYIFIARCWQWLFLVQADENLLEAETDS